jgi:PhoH-like ATPase
MLDGVAYRFDGANLVALRTPKESVVKAKNAEQAILLDMLWNDDIKAKVATGIAGSGKTFLSLRVGLAKVAMGKYARVIVIRNPVVIGKDIGYLKGDYATKLEPWTRPIIDNLDGGRQEFERLTRQPAPQLEFDVLGFVQGASLNNSFIIVTEAQNMTRLQAKMAGTRCGENSVIVFDGDIEQTGDAQYERDNGLRAIVETFAGESWFAHMRLETSVRSIVAAQFGKRL